jgi:hypothetical protein
VFDIHTEIPNGTYKLHHVKQLAVFQNEPFTIPYDRINHLRRHWNKPMLTIVQTPFTADVLDGFLSSMKCLSLTTRSPFPSIFFGLGPLLKTPITAVVLNGFLLSMKGSSSTARSPFPSVFFGLGVIIKAAKPNCILPIGDDDSLYKNRSSGELIVMKNQ